MAYGQRPADRSMGALPENSALMKLLMRHLHSKKGQDRTLPASMWMRYKAVEQETL